MTRLRMVGALTGALLAALSVATIAGAWASGDNVGVQAQDYTFGVGSYGPGCWATHSGQFCTPYRYTVRLMGVGVAESGSAWGTFERRNDDLGGRFVGRVTCVTVDGGRAAIGGFLTHVAAPPSEVGMPFVYYVADNGTLGSGTPDEVSVLSVLPDYDPDRALMPARFPYVCPSADSIYGYVPLTSGDITVSDA